MREPQTQACPEWTKVPNADIGIAFFSFASSKISTGDLPPSSRVTLLRLLSAAACTIARPTSVEPVNATFSTSGCAVIAAPTVWPYPFTRFATPSGTPASARICINTCAERGVSSAGLTTLLQPAASDGASLAQKLNTGPFHGKIRPTTPYGSRTV